MLENTAYYLVISIPFQYFFRWLCFCYSPVK